MQGSSLMFYIEVFLSVLFGTAGAKRTKNAEIISPLRRRRGLRALDLRKLLEKFDQNFHPVRVNRWGGRRKNFREWVVRMVTVIRAFYAFTSLPVILSAT